jgi:hypothetical protein
MSGELVKSQNNVAEDNGAGDKSVSGMSVSVVCSDSANGCTEAPRSVGVDNGGDSVEE